MQEKIWWQSRELILAILTGIAGVLAVVVTQYPGIGYLVIANAVLDALLLISSSGVPIGGKVGRLGRALLGKE